MVHVMKKIIQKAIDGGWKPTDNGGEVEEIKPTNGGYWFFDTYGTGLHLNYVAFIFSHDFLKAYFGGEMTCICGEPILEDDEVSALCDHNYDIVLESEAWQYHGTKILLLETMEERIEYLRRFL